jgi:TetR/AcrR family transcriptional regulator
MGSLMQRLSRKSGRRGRGRPSDNGPGGDLVLLQAARSAFARHGFEGATLRGIATSAGVDPALVAHHFGSKEALWEAVIEHMAQILVPLIAELRELQKKTQIPIRARLETALRQLIAATCEDPEVGMFISRIGAEQGEKLDLLIRKLILPYHDAFQPLLAEAMRAKVIGRQPVEVLYFMLLNSVMMTISYRHILEHFGERFEDIERLKKDMTHCVLVTFFEKGE